MKTRFQALPFQSHSRAATTATLSICGMLLCAGSIVSAAEPVNNRPPSSATTPTAGSAGTGKPASVRITQMRGRVMINQDGSYQVARNNQTIPPGAKIITGEDGMITMIYADGCVRDLRANSMFTVPTISECAGAAPVERIYVAAPANGTPTSTTQTTTTQTTTTLRTPPKSGTSLWTYVAGAAGAGLAGTALSGDGDGRKNISDE